MQILPVLDLLGGTVVRGIAGRRSEYRPVVSRLTPNSDPLSVARAFRDQFGLARLYVADLDAILHQRPNLEIYRRLAGEGFELLVDAGLREIRGAETVIKAGAAKVIAGLETWPGPADLAALCRRLGAARIIFSLDLHEGSPLGDRAIWGTSDPFEIAGRAVECGVTELIVLDLAQVGVGDGVTTALLCRRLIQTYPDLDVITGGGVRDMADVRSLQDSGLRGVLLASTLHNGRIGRSDVDALTSRGP